VQTRFTYFQMVFGYMAGLWIVAFFLLPVYYRTGDVSIYGFLRRRFGPKTHKTGAVLFLAAQLATASFKLFLMAYVLQLILFDQLRIPFEVTVLGTLLLIWLYTYRGGIQTVIFTDILQTTALLLAALFTLLSISHSLGFDLTELYGTMRSRGYAQVFDWSWRSPHNFFKLVLTGILLTVMTNGLDQSVMQKHLTCRDLRSSQKNIVTLSLILLGVNALFLLLGGSLRLFADQQALILPAQTDAIYPELAIHLGGSVAILFLLGVAAAAYSSADSSLTGLTTSFCVDILGLTPSSDDRAPLRKGVHLAFSLLIYLIILGFSRFHNQSVLSAFIRTAGYLYGPLMALFAFGILSRRRVPDAWLPVLCIVAPLSSWVLDTYAPTWFGYQFGYDILLVNTLLTFFGLYLLSLRNSHG